MLEAVIAIQTLLIVALVALQIRTHERLFRAAMSRTPSHFRAAEKADKRPEPIAKNLVEIDEAAQAVIASMAPGSKHPMPHGLGGA